MQTKYMNIHVLVHVHSEALFMLMWIQYARMSLLRMVFAHIFPSTFLNVKKCIITCKNVALCACIIRLKQRQSNLALYREGGHGTPNALECLQFSLEWAQLITSLLSMFTQAMYYTMALLFQVVIVLVQDDNTVIHF
jgi:hypothetical protein